MIAAATKASFQTRSKVLSVRSRPLLQCEEIPDAITSADVLIQLNTDFSLKGMSSQDLQAVVAAWQAGALSRDTMFELFRRGEILPDGRTNQDEAALVRAGLVEAQ